MGEVQAIDRAVGATERLFVVDSMAGQDAVRAAQSFNAALDLTGVILTKADGDARGGAALSVRQVTGKPILFVGVGEKTDALETFHPERIASRILGMGDVVSLIEQVRDTADQEKAAKLADKLTKGKGFDFTDLREQLAEFNRMGGLQALASKLPNQALPPGRARPGGRPHDPPPARHHRRHDPRGAAPAGDHRRLPQAPDRRRGGGPRPGSEPTPQAIHADGKGHEEDAGRRARKDDAEPQGLVPGRPRAALGQALPARPKPFIQRVI